MNMMWLLAMSGRWLTNQRDGWLSFEDGWLTQGDLWLSKRDGWLSWQRVFSAFLLSILFLLPFNISLQQKSFVEDVKQNLVFV